MAKPSAIPPHDLNRKKPIKRAFTGLAGSPLAVVMPPKSETDDELKERLIKERKAWESKQQKEAALQNKYNTMLAKAGLSASQGAPRSPRTPDPSPLDCDEWKDQFDQRLGAIDIDCSFQEFAFDPKLGRGTRPDDGSGHAGGRNLEKEGAPTLEETFGGSNAASGFKGYPDEIDSN
jgi:hypothetical protein